jgi:hypothetical protein
MPGLTIPFLLSGTAFLFIFFSGYLLTRIGKPYNMLIITIHKLVGVALGVYLGLRLYRQHQVAGLNSISLVIITVTVLFFILMVTTGSLLSAERSFPDGIKLLHRVFPYLTVTATAVLIFLIP